MKILYWPVNLSSSVVLSWRLFGGLSWPSGGRVSSLAWVVVVPSWSWVMAEVVPSWSWVVAEVGPFCPLVVAEVVVVVVSSPWLTPHANTEPL